MQKLSKVYTIKLKRSSTLFTARLVYNGITMPRSRTRRAETNGVKVMGILFLDITEFSKLTQRELENYVRTVLPDLNKVLAPHRKALFALNTWGDAIMAASEDPVSLARLSLALRDYFQTTTFAKKNLPNNLLARIALHTGTVYYGRDALRGGGKGIIGTNVNLAARIEPIITPGEVWVTDELVLIIKDHLADEKLALDPLGERDLAKGYGIKNLFRLRRDHEPGLPPEPRQTRHGEGRPAKGELLSSREAPTNLYDIVGTFHKFLVRYETNGVTDEHEYGRLRQELLRNPKTKRLLPALLANSKTHRELVGALRVSVLKKHKRVEHLDHIFAKIKKHLSNAEPWYPTL